jgi:fluoride ion exporter CrcB/FEX
MTSTSDLSRIQGPGVASPPRRPGSVRRTSTIDMWWPEGWGTSTHIRGRARDLLTPAGATEPSTVAEDVLDAIAAPDRTIEQIRSYPERAGLPELVGARAGSRLRAALSTVVPDERRRGTPLYLLLDDLAGSTLIGGFAFIQWPQEWPAHWRDDRTLAFRGRRMEGVCIGFRTGSTALTADGEAQPVDNTRAVAPLADPDDAAGWHEFCEVDGVSMRRARRIDVWLDEHVEIDAMFQDSATSPTGGRIAVHEYQVRARAHRDTFELLSITAIPRVLPFGECPAAVTKIGQLTGTPLVAMRDEVLARLKTTEGCTHLNDELRALAEVPALVEHLRAGPIEVRR